MKKYYKILIFSFLVILAGCRSAEKLIDKAIKKDPKIVIHTTDTVTEFQTFIDSIPYYINDSIAYEKIIYKKEIVTITNNRGVEIERKKTRQEIRKNASLQKKIETLNAKNERLEIRLNAKNEKRADKEKNKTDRVTVRQENKKTRWFIWFIIGAIVGVFSYIAVKQFIKNSFRS